MKRRIAAALLAAIGFGLAPLPEDGVRLDPALPNYAPVTGVSGGLKTVGSDTMGNLVALWAEQLGKFHPGIKVQVEAKGSSTGPTALMEGQAQFAPMSRAMDPSEVRAFTDKFGYEPSRLRVAIDCVAIMVHTDCPIDEITVTQLQDLFSVSGPEMTWGDLGAKNSAWANRPVSLYGRNSASGTYKFFKKAALGGNDFKPSVKETPGSAGVVAAIAEDTAGLGYSGIGFATPDIKILRVAFDDDFPAVDPTPEFAETGEYPLARYLYVYMNVDRREPLDSTREAFVRMIYSREGQEAVIKDGAYPISSSFARGELEQLGL